ncbi:MAG: RNA polymerase sigma factor [Vicinamibacterales bacterium]
MQPHQSGLRSWLRHRFPWLLADVDDIAQEAALRLWKRQQAQTAAPLKSPKALLYTIARNAAIDQRRHALIEKTDSLPDLAHLPVSDEKPGIEHTVAAREELEFLADGLRRLPDRCRQVMTLTKVYGLTEREVGERLGMAESTVRTHVVRGMKSLAAYLRARGYERSQ